MKIANQITYLKEVDSTNRYLHKLISNLNPKIWHAVIADYQTEGKGQIGRTWESKANKNLLFSFVIYPEFLAAKDQFVLSKYVSVAIKNLLDSLGISNVTIKWPNDIYINDRKVAGILIQNNLKGKNIQSCIIGIGLNINQINFSACLPNPTSIAKELKKEFDIGIITEQLISLLNLYYQKLEELEFNYFKSKYIESLYRINERQLFSDGSKDFHGKIIGVDEIGRLMVELESGFIKSYNFNEVKYII